MFFQILVWCSLSWIAVLGLRISSIDNQLTPLKLFFLIKLTPKSAGGVEVFNGLDFSKSSASFKLLLSMKTIYFQGFFNMSCRTMSLHRFLKMTTHIGEGYHLSFACLDNLRIFKEYGTAIVKIVPDLVIDHVPSSSTYSEMFMKPLQKQTLYSTRTRTSIPFCKALSMGSYLSYFAANEDYWRMSDAYCLMAAPELATFLLPDVYDINLRSDLIIDSLDKMIHTLAVVLTLNRLELRDDIRTRIFTAILMTKLKKQQLFSRFVNVQSDLAMAHNVLGSYLGQLIQKSLVGMERDMRREAKTIYEPLQKVWKQAELIRSKSVFGYPWGIRHNIIMIFAEILPDHKLPSLSGKLEHLLNNNVTQERVICSIFDIIKARKSTNAMVLIEIINKHLIKRGVQRPFKCRKPAGYGRNLPLKQDRMVMLRRHAMEHASEFLLSDQTGRSILFPEPINLDGMRTQLVRKLQAVIDDDCFFAMDSIGRGPFLFFNLATHPYKSSLLWDLLNLSATLRLRMPFEIHPALALVYLEGSEESMDDLFHLLVKLEFKDCHQKSVKLKRAQQLEAYNCFRTCGWRFNFPTKNGFSFYQNHLALISLQLRTPSLTPSLKCILENYHYYWRQNFSFCEIEDLASVAGNHLDLAGYLVNPDLSKCK